MSIAIIQVWKTYLTAKEVMVGTNVLAVRLNRVTKMDLRAAKGSPTWNGGWIAKQDWEDTKTFGLPLTWGLDLGQRDAVRSVLPFVGQFQHISRKSPKSSEHHPV